MKELRIKQILVDLNLVLEKGSFKVIDHWAADLTAIGITSLTDESLYIRVLEDGCFDVILETAARAGEEIPYVESGSYEYLTFDELTEITRSYFQVYPD